MECSKCGNEIQEGRLKAIPETTTCVSCSGVEKVAGFRIITGKSTYTELEITTQERCNHLNKIQNRRGSVSLGVSMQSYAMANRSEEKR